MRGHSNVHLQTNAITISQLHEDENLTDLFYMARVTQDLSTHNDSIVDNKEERLPG